MRISNEQAQQILAAQKLKGAKGAQGASEASQASPATAVSMSQVGQEIGKALGALASIPDVRQERVAAIKAQIAAGEYHVSGREVADSLLRRAADQLL